MIAHNPWNHLLWVDVWHLFVWFAVLWVVIPFTIELIIERVSGTSTSLLIKKLRRSL